ncbi:DUF6197 family protein [Streptomyces caniscabiei]|uniref:DUF6197 family protein n=1 Tax=Streptomyces caniscabiei TaxID=2746961 RepID=UPI0029BCA72D|nr:hypothetical protein [Streptomyces caniscabiei]MDX2986513.1 hypothetical protein [Streptomyces caniscabiei]
MDQQTRTEQRPRTAPPSPAPTRVPTTPARVQPVQAPPSLLDPPTWGQRLLPKHLRQVMAGLGWWQDPVPQPPSLHLLQVREALERYGWCKSLDVSPTGRMCIRGCQSLLEKSGHVTPRARARAEHYMQHVLAQDGIRMPFHAWNDLPERDFPHVTALLTSASYQARANGE